MFAVYGYEEEDDEVGINLGSYVSPFGSASMDGDTFGCGLLPSQPVATGCADGCTDCGPCGVKKWIPYALVALGAWFLLK